VVSLWLNPGCARPRSPAAPGTGFGVLLKIYAYCTDGQADAANRRMLDALGAQDAEPESGDGQCGDSAQALFVR
jgi:hypothetical protein